MKRWKSVAPPARHDLVGLELMRDIRALLYVLALQGSDTTDRSDAFDRLRALERERMEHA